MAKQCPICKNSFNSEEFCPVHFVPLVSPPEISATHTGAVEKISEDPTSPHEELSLVERMKKMFKGSFKRKGEKASEAATERSGSTVPSGIELPVELRETGWLVSGEPVSIRGVDVWPVQRKREDRVVSGQLVVYASGVLTDVPTYQRLLELGTNPARAHLHAFGTVDRGHKVRAAYELITLPGVSQTLDTWLRDSPASEERALSFLPGLRDLLQDCAASGLLPITLDPAFVQRSMDGRLRIVRFGAMLAGAADGTACVYRPEFAHSSLLPSPWTAPEIKSRLVVTPQSLVFSVAQILAAALFGQAPSLHDVQSGLIPLGSIQNPLLARLLMGGLWPHADGRWSLAEMLTALEATSVEQMPAAPAWSRLMPGAAETAFDLGGESFYRFEDAVAKANKPKHWDEAVQRMDALLLWAASGTAWKGVAEGLRTELTTGTRSSDWVLVRLTRQVCPRLPLTWRGLDCSDTHAQASLVAQAQQALTSETPDFTVLRQLYRADLRGAFTVPG